MDKPESNPFHRLLEVGLDAERILAERSWFLLSCYGKLMDGPSAGRCASGIAGNAQRELVHRVLRGRQRSPDGPMALLESPL